MKSVTTFINGYNMRMYENSNKNQKGEKVNRGGKRKGAGRKKNSEPTTTVRVPISQKEKIQKWNQIGEWPSDAENVKDEIRDILQRALSLRANAGGRIKEEIRKVLSMI